jgi:hypothetical protein
MWLADCPRASSSSGVRLFVSMSRFDLSSLESLVGRGLLECQLGGAELSAPCELSEVLAQTVHVGARIGFSLWRFCSNL